MLIALHKNARTTPAVRAEIAASNEPASVLAQRFGITEQTVYKWKKRSVFADRSHTAHRLQTVLTPAQETVVVHLRRTLLLPLDDLLAVTREFICPNVSRSGLDRCLRRHGAGNLNALKPNFGRQTPSLSATAYALSCRVQSSTTPVCFNGSGYLRCPTRPTIAFVASEWPREAAWSEFHDRDSPGPTSSLHFTDHGRSIAQGQQPSAPART